MRSIAGHATQPFTHTREPCCRTCHPLAARIRAAGYAAHGATQKLFFVSDTCAAPPSLSTRHGATRRSLLRPNMGAGKDLPLIPGAIVDIAIVLALFLGGALLLVLAAWLARERRVVRALVAGGLGLLVLLVTWARISPALLDTEAAQLRVRVTQLDRDANVLRSDKTRLEAETGRLANHVAAAEAQSTDLQRKRESELDATLGEIAQLRAVFTSPGSGLILDPVPARNPRADRADQVRDEIRSLALIRAQPAVQLAPTPAVVERVDQTRDLMRLKDKMGARLSTPSYDVEVYPDKEMIRGRQGRYYVVDMKNAMSGIRYHFEGGKYTLARSSQEFRSSLNTFVADILSKFEGNVRYDLYVRGSADIKPYEGRFEPGQEFRTINFLKNLGGDKYGVDTGLRTVGDVVRNLDLPDLRAAFLQKIVADSYPLKRPIILEGAVSPKADDRDRNVELLLFVDW